ncbi:hypothetical protein D3C87_1252880 [compost metagenome]
MRNDIARIQPVDAIRVDRIHGRTLSLAEGNIAIKPIRYHQNIGKEDSGIKTEPANGLKGHFGCQFGIITEIEETAGVLSRFPVLRKVTPCLPHQPYGRRCDRLPVQHL